VPRGFGMGWQARGYGRGFMGNVGPNCRMYPWLPRRWWDSSVYPAGAYTTPYSVGMPAEYLQAQAQFLKTQLAAIERQMKQLEKKDNDDKEQ